ncbi:MAG: tetratricopeptide repeat protein [Chloroflexi bacterium]|nr:tetratricopeptide repeat protein [Chloroflexota bacterium]
MNLFASFHNEQGRKFLDQGVLEKAEAAFRKSLDLSPNSSATWYNLGLVYKKQRKWNVCLECNQRATQLNPRDEAALWNLGIAATALSQWNLARHAWKKCGVEIPDGDGELTMDLGPVPIRLNPDDSGEVIWCSRIDPARAIIRGVPLPSSCHRFGDVLLHDGALNGFRIINGNKIPVFDELELLEPSKFSTFQVAVTADSLDDIHALIELAFQQNMGAEDWSTIRPLCKECSEGTPHEHPEDQFQPQAERRIGIAAMSEMELDEILESWLISHPTARLISVNCVLKSWNDRVGE